MFKKGPIQLQTEITTDEELDDFLAKEGIAVLEIFQEWSGPCVATTSTFKKLKLEIGDAINLGAVNADTVPKFHRFTRRCEPTFIICSHSKIVRALFSPNIPNLMNAVREEVQVEEFYKAGKAQRVFYDIDKECPEELKRDAEIIAIRKDKERKAKAKADREFREKMHYLIREINENIVDFWVGLLMPHEAHNYPKIVERARSLGLNCKDRKLIQFKREMIPILNYHIKNPLKPEVLDFIVDKEVLAICWLKSNYIDSRPFEEVIPDLYYQIMNPPPPRTPSQTSKISQTSVISTASSDHNLKTLVVLLDDDGETRESHEKTSIISQEHASKVSVKKSVVVVKPEEEVQPEEIPAEPQKSASIEKEPEAVVEPVEETVQEIVVLESVIMKNEDNDEKPAVEEEVEEVKEENEIVEEPEPEIQENQNKIEIPPLWTPFNAEANSLFIYVFFKKLTEFFIPPEPEPEPDHNLIIFPASMKKEVFDICKAFEKDILSYGFFRSDDLENPKLICKNFHKYAEMKQTLNDKLIMKVSAKTDHALLALVQLEPIYVSMNVTEGKKDCAKVFNEAFDSFEDEVEEPRIERPSPRKTQTRRKSVVIPERPERRFTKAKSVEIVTMAETVIDLEEP